MRFWCSDDGEFAVRLSVGGIEYPPFAVLRGYAGAGFRWSHRKRLMFHRAIQPCTHAQHDRKTVLFTSIFSLHCQLLSSVKDYKEQWSAAGSRGTVVRRTGRSWPHSGGRTSATPSRGTTRLSSAASSASGAPVRIRSDRLPLSWSSEAKEDLGIGFWRSRARPSHTSFQLIESQTLLSWAVEKGSLGCGRLLLRLGASPRQPDAPAAGDHCAFCWALICGRIDFVRLFLGQLSVEMSTLLRTAAGQSSVAALCPRRSLSLSVE